ncbi:hypothetical protein [Paraburkholderia megapolitana]|uniref:hypothetical protein n=1 Tax=Paraburkholderia megapolitana TaxID=420953 RepID=UPI0038B744AD
MSSTRAICACLALLFGLCGTAVRAESPHLTLDDIDQLSRNKVVKSLTDNPAGNQQTAAVPSPEAAPPSAASSTPAPVPEPRHEASRQRSRAEPVTFVGAWRDAAGASVLYEFEGAVYSARVGTKLLNGWTARKVDGFLVTVADGRRTWSEPLRGGSVPSFDTNAPLQALNDLNNPLPPGGIGSGTQVIVPLGR